MMIQFSARQFLFIKKNRFVNEVLAHYLHEMKMCSNASQTILILYATKQPDEHI